MPVRTKSDLNKIARRYWDNPNKSLKDISGLKTYSDEEKDYMHSEYKRLQEQALRKKNKQKYGF